MSGIEPNVVIFLDVSAETAMVRREKSNGDPFDILGDRYFRRIVAGYRELYNNQWGNLNWQRINAEQPLITVFREAEKIVNNLYNLPNDGSSLL